MRNNLNKMTASMLLATATLMVASFVIPNNVKALDLTSLGGSAKGNVTQKSMRINADSMDIDINNNIAKVTGNVYVDHPEMTIKCKEMIINLVDKKAAVKDSKKKKKTAGVGGFNLGGGSKDVSTIICIGNVVITRKVYDKEEKAKGAQTAKSGRAVLDAQKSIITFTEDEPILSRGKDSVEGKIITVYLKSNRLKVDGNSIIQFDVNEGRKDHLKENPKVPKKNTVIKSDSSDINLNKNIASFVGNVDIDDAMADLKCKKMDVYFTEDQQLATPERSTIQYFTVDKKQKTIDQIVCVGDVVMNRHLYSKEDIAGGEQKAIAQKAVFTNEDSQLVLTGTPDEWPIISRGGALTSGSKIFINTKTQKIKYIDFSGDIPMKDINGFNSK